jgi:hypothetical protein
MRISTFFALSIILIAFWQCTNIDDASLSKRKTFIHFYEGPLSFVASDLLVEDDGNFVILGNMTQTIAGVPQTQTILIKTDKYGNQIGNTAFYSGGSGNAIKPYSSGYIIIGDSINVNQNASDVADIEISSARILLVANNFYESTTFGLIDKIYISDLVNTTQKIDIKGSSVAIKDDGGIIFLLTYEEVGSTVKPWLKAYKNDLTEDWEYKFESLVRDYINGKSIHHINGETIWANSLLRQQGSFNEKYVSITKVPDYLSSSNYSLLGENMAKSISAADFQPSKFAGFGFGVVGTLSNTDGSGQNMFFTRVNVLGSINNPPDTIFIDAFRGKTSSTVSRVEDVGIAITATIDGGFVMAGSTLTASIDNKNFGNGERDILLVRVNAIGELIWMKVIGGTGDEVVSTIRETSDNGLLISGTNDVKGYSSIFLIKTDKNGELKN